MDIRKQVELHLKKYGIKKQFFASYIGIYPAHVTPWMQGKYELTRGQMKRVEDFLNWKYTEALI